MPLAPGRFSTITGALRAAESLSLISRATISGTLPGEAPSKMRRGLSGKASSRSEPPPNALEAETPAAPPPIYPPACPPVTFFHLDARNCSGMLRAPVESPQPNAGTVYELDIRAAQPRQGVNIVLVPRIRPGCANRCKCERITLR